MPVSNETGADISADFPVLAIDGPIFNSADRADVVWEGVKFKGATPDSSTSEFVIVQGPIPDGGLRPAVLRGPTWCEIDVTDESHTHATLKPGDNTKLASSTSGVKIEWRETGTGTKKAILILGGNSTYQLIRGTTTAAVTPLQTAFQITGIKAFEENARLPDSPVWVAVPPGGVTLDSGDYVWAAYHKDFTTIDPDGEGGDDPLPVDWVMIPTNAAASTPVLRRFEATTAKVRATNSFTARFLDHADNMVGDPVTIHDPQKRFNTKIAGYVDSIRGHIGTAILRTDLAGLTADRWEVVTCDGIAKWVIVTYAGSPDNEWRLTNWGGGQWEFKKPVASNTALTIDDPQDFFSSPTTGDQAYAELTNPDTSPPTYEIRNRVMGVVIGTTTANVLASASSFGITPTAAVYGPLPASSLTVQQLFPVGYAIGQKVLAIQTGPTTWTNTPDSGKIRLSASDMAPDYWLNKFTLDAATYDPLLHDLVKIATVNVGGDETSTLFVDKSGGGDGGAVTVLIDADIAGAVWDEANKEFAFTALALKYFSKNGSDYELAVADAGPPIVYDTMTVEWHDLDGFVVGTVDGESQSANNRYLGFAVKNDDGAYVLTTIMCKPLPEVA